MNTCLFCKIIAGEIPSTKILETDDILVISDIHPKAPTHLLILPKQHIENLFQVTQDHAAMLAHLLLISQKLVTQLKISTEGFKLVIRNGRNAGQEIDHLHLHFLSDKKTSV